MEPFVTLIHIFVALILIALVLIQDNKSGSLGGAFGGGGSNSVLGATGAATLVQKLTRWTAVIFAATSIGLSVFASKSHRSVVDGMTAPAAAAAPADPAAPAATAPVPEAKDAAPAATAPATTPEKK